MNRIVRMVLGNLFFAPPAYVKLCKYAKAPEKYSKQEMWDHISYMLQRATKAGNIDLEVTGIENLPQEEGFLMYGNHQGMFDVLGLAATCKLPLSALSKQENANYPFLKQVLICTESYLMDRSDVRQSLKLMRQISQDVPEGRRVLIFPEGTRSKKGNDMIEFHDGSFKPALKAKCPIVPIAFVNSFAALDQKGSKPVHVGIHYLDPIPYEEYKDMKTPQLADYVKARIQAAIDADPNRL